MSQETAQTPAPALVDVIKGLTDKFTALEGQVKSVQEESRKVREQGPFVRSGENVMSSRGYSFTKALGVLSGQIAAEDAKVEVGISNALKKYHSGYTGYEAAKGRSFMLPLGGDLLTNEPALGEEIRQVSRAGARPFGPDEVQAMKRDLGKLGYTKALSWIDESTGGALVAPPQFGELIELLRNNEVFMAAGARVLPMPPQGRITYPRQTTAMSAFHVGESTNLTESTPGTGDVVLSAKKLTILAKIPNELFHFSAIPIEAFVREDMTKVVALKMDKTLLEDPGSMTTPKGLINYANIVSYTSADPGTVTDGYRIQPVDAYNMVAKTEEQNAQFKAFIMRPLLWATLIQRRADAVTAGDGKGPFVFNLFREISDDFNVERLRVANLIGYPCYKTTQLSIARAKGASTNLTYVVGGNFTDYLLAMGGALEFQVSTQGDTPFVADQTWFKGVLYYDGAPRHEASFVLMDNMYQNT